jgi:integrase
MSVTHLVDDDMPKGLQRREGWYYIRKRIPLDVQDAFGGKEMHVKSLGTNDPREAKRLHAIALAKLEIEFHQIRENNKISISNNALLDESLSGELFDEVSFYRRTLQEINEAKSNGELKEYREFLKGWLDIDRRLIEGEYEHHHSYSTMLKQRNVIQAILNGDPFTPIPQHRATFDEIEFNESNSIDPSLLITLIKQWNEERKPKARTLKRTIRLCELVIDFAASKKAKRLDKKLFHSFVQTLKDDNLTNENINVYLGMIRTIINYGVNNCTYESNPLTGISLTEAKSAKAKRRPWTIDELGVLFSSSIYRSRDWPIAGGKDAAYWLPLLALYTGARQTELGQLHPTDIYQERYRKTEKLFTSAWVVRLVFNEERGQDLKNEGSERRIPIHQQLIDLGFLNYVKSAQFRNQDRLFPDIRPSKEGELMANWSKWFGRYRRSIGLTGKEPVFHGLRHNFKDYAKLSGISSDVSNALTGHVTGDVADSYGSITFPLKPLVIAIQRIDIPKFDLRAYY